ncbi:hypothetical protein J7E96_11630 [Streptomyces sp. ISL-96]|nr:hypothetical protein [Streptomyces sp. ISL-96]MBT2489160.1 hypothetical protein [Streptomyces sp. ISL-96]
MQREVSWSARRLEAATVAPSGMRRSRSRAASTWAVVRQVARWATSANGNEGSSTSATVTVAASEAPRGRRAGRRWCGRTA